MQQRASNAGAARQDGGGRRVTRDLLDRVRGEYREMPGLCLSPAQAARLWGLSPHGCAGVLDTLIAQGDLTCTKDGRYVATSRLLTVQERERGDRRRVA